MSQIIPSTQGENTFLPLTFRLLKQDKKISDCLKRKYLNDDENLGLRYYHVPSFKNIDLYYGTVYTGNVLPWLNFLKSGVGHLSDLSNAGIGAVIFVSLKNKNRIMAISFGYAHSILDLNAFERNFGLIVALNNIDSHKISTFDIDEPGVTSFQKRIHAVTGSMFNQFDIDKDRDIPKMIIGKPKENSKSLAASLKGSDSLTIQTQISFSELNNKCEAILEQYFSEEYKKGAFEWVTNIQPIKDSSLILTLNKELLSALNLVLANPSKKFGINLNIPRIPDDRIISSYEFEGPRIKTKKRHIDLNMKNFAESFENSIRFHVDTKENITAQKNKYKVKINFEDGASETFSIYRCLNFEHLIKNHQKKSSHNILFNGQWYLINPEYVERINNFISDKKNLPIKEFTTKQNSEQALAEKELTLKDDLICLDQKLVSVGDDENSSIEACDFFSMNKEFVHVKDGKASDTISHLWFQAFVSAENFVSNEKFRNNLIDVVKRQEIEQNKSGFVNLILEDPSLTPKTNEYKIVLAVMRTPYKIGKKKGLVDLPFFSKVSLKTTVEKITRMGFSIELHYYRKEGKPSKKKKGSA